MNNGKQDDGDGGEENASSNYSMDALIMMQLAQSWWTRA